MCIASSTFLSRVLRYRIDETLDDPDERDDFAGKSENFPANHENLLRICPGFVRVRVVARVLKCA